MTIRMLTNANIYTMAPTQPTVSSLAIRGGKIIAIGDQDVVASSLNGNPEIINLEGQTVIPGLIDSHIHLEQFALGLEKIDCDTVSKVECLKRVADKVQNSAADEWILGHGWNQNYWEGGFGSAEELDTIAPHQPIYLTAKSLHAAWVNSAALRLAGIQQSTPDPQGGRIGRDQHGYPNGILYESAMEIVQERVPSPNLEKVTQSIHSALPQLWKLGLTGAHDFDRRTCFAALQLLQERGKLSFRIAKSIPLEDLPQAIDIGLRSGFGNDYLTIGSVKMFADGALGPRTAAMIQPYESEPDNRGILLLDAEELFEHGKSAIENGISIAVHAIGDLANHEVLNAFTQLRDYETENMLPRLRHRIEHVQLVHPDDAGRLADLNIIASMQPIHATSDMDMADRYWGNRSDLAYAWRTQLDHETVLVFGSDAPVESPNPFLGLYAATTRLRANQRSRSTGWYPEQIISINEALRAYTTGAAYAVGWERKLGRIAPGYYADLVVLDSNPFTCEYDVLLDMEPHATMIAGEWVYIKN